MRKKKEEIKRVAMNRHVTLFFACWKPKGIIFFKHQRIWTHLHRISMCLSPFSRSLSVYFICFHPLSLMFTNWPFVSNLSCYLNVFRPCFALFGFSSSSVPLCVRTISAPRPAARDAKDSAVRQSQNQTCHVPENPRHNNQLTLINSSTCHCIWIGYLLYFAIICW